MKASELISNFLSDTTRRAYAASDISDAIEGPLLDPETRMKLHAILGKDIKTFSEATRLHELLTACLDAAKKKPRQS